MVIQTHVKTLITRTYVCVEYADWTVWSDYLVSETFAIWKLLGTHAISRLDFLDSLPFVNFVGSLPVDFRCNLNFYVAGVLFCGWDFASPNFRLMLSFLLPSSVKAQAQASSGQQLAQLC